MAINSKNSSGLFSKETVVPGIIIGLILVAGWVASCLVDSSVTGDAVSLSSFTKKLYPVASSEKCTYDQQCGDVKKRFCKAGVCADLPVDKIKCSVDADCGDVAEYGCSLGKCFKRISEDMARTSAPLVCKIDDDCAQYGANAVCRDDRCVEICRYHDDCKDDEVCSGEKCVARTSLNAAAGKSSCRMFRIQKMTSEKSSTKKASYYAYNDKKQRIDLSNTMPYEACNRMGYWNVGGMSANAKGSIGWADGSAENAKDTGYLAVLDKKTFEPEMILCCDLKNIL